MTFLSFFFFDLMKIVVAVLSQKDKGLHNNELLYQKLTTVLTEQMNLAIPSASQSKAGQVKHQMRSHTCSGQLAGKIIFAARKCIHCFDILQSDVY